MIAKAMMLMLCCFVAAVSCDTYDDSEIWETIKELQEKIDALEKKVADNVSAIQSIVTLESVKSCVFDAETGKVTITLLDGKTIVIDQTVKGYSLITVTQDSDGEYYWALCKDGQTEFLLINGAKVPVTVTPALKISDSNEWLISVDGGKTWVSTGIYQETSEDDKDDSDAPAAVFFTDVRMEGDYLYLTLVDGTVVKVAVIGEAGMNVSPDSLWFSRASMLKTASVEMNNVKSYTITEKPEGWNVFIEDSYLNVTSPEDFNSAAKQGTVKILALFNGGVQPEILSVSVAYEYPFTLSLDNEAVAVRLSEHTGDDYTGYILAAWPESDFTPELAVEWLNGEGAQSVPYSGNSSYAVADLVENFSAKEDYVVFAAPYLPAAQVVQGKMSYAVTDLCTVMFENEGESWKLSDVSYDNAHLKATFTEITKYYGGIFESGAWEGYGRDNILEALTYDGLQVCNATRYDGPVSGFPFNDSNEDLLPSTEYVIWMLPYKSTGRYTEQDFIIRTFTTKGIVEDTLISAPKASIDEITISGFAATVTPASGAYKTYAAIRPAYAIPEDGLESVTDMMRLGNYSTGSKSLTVSTGSYDADTELYLLAVSVMEDGRYGKILKQKVELKELVFSDALSVSVTDIQYGLGDVTLSLEFTGSPVNITYFAETFTFYSDEEMQRLLALGQLGNATKVKIAELDGGKLNISGLTVGSLYTFYAVVADSESVSSKLYKYDFTPRVEVDYVLSSSADYEYGMPSLSGTWIENKTYSLNVDMPAQCVKYWLFVGDSGYFTGDPWTDSDKMFTMALYGETVHTESLKGYECQHMHKESRIYMVWLDDKGAYHAVYEYNPQNDR